MTLEPDDDVGASPPPEQSSGRTSRPLGRRTLIASMVASALAMTVLPDLLRPGAAHAATTYMYPFPLSTTPTGGFYGSTFTDQGPRAQTHRGHDFAVAAGTPIPAVAEGVVRTKISHSSLGNVVAVQHPDGMSTAYAHMQSQSTLGIGTAVARGAIVGRVGSTGQVTGAHLHLAMAPLPDDAANGRNTRDPISYIRDRLAGGPPTQQAKGITMFYLRNDNTGQVGVFGPPGTGYYVFATVQEYNNWRGMVNNYINPINNAGLPPVPDLSAVVGVDNYAWGLAVSIST